MIDRLDDLEAVTRGRLPYLIDHAEGGLRLALLEQQATHIEGGVAQEMPGTTQIADFLRRNALLDAERGLMPVQTDVHFTSRLFEATVGILAELYRGDLGLHTYGFDEQERGKVVGLVTAALLETSPHIHRDTSALVSALRAADTVNFEPHLSNVRIGLVRRYAATVGDLNVTSLMLQRRHLEISEALHGETMTTAERLGSLAHFAEWAASIYG